MANLIPYFQCSGLNNNTPTHVRVTSITRGFRKNIFNQAIPGTNNTPNNELDFIGTNNHNFTIQGVIPTRSGVDYSDGIGNLHATELDISGLGILETTGSEVWFVDTLMGITGRMSGGTLLAFASGVKVQVASVNVKRNSDWTDAGHEIGYVLPFNMTLVETV